MEKMTKGELQAWAGMFAVHICRGVGNPEYPNIQFSHPGYNNGEPMSLDTLCARIDTIDPELSKRFRACYDATARLGSYIHERIETPKR